MGTPLAALLVLLSVTPLCGQKLFANTKFDLDSNLPVEEPSVAKNEDSPPKVVTKAPEVAPTTAAPSQAPTRPATTTTTTTTAAPPTPPTIVQLGVIASGASPFSTLPPLIPLPSIVDGQPLLPPQIVPVATAPTAHLQQQIVPITPPARGTPVQQTSSQQQTNHAPLQPPLNAHLAPAHVSSPQSDRVDLWFREDFDLTYCPKDGETISTAFRKKFPKNLLRNGKETILAELLSTRIKECQRKQANDHWSRMEKVVLFSPLPSTEKEECRAGLVQEQISCLNVLSFSCQFVQPAYIFRLVPTRLIVQEARLAEDGADKCRKFVGKFKHQLHN